MLDAGAKFSARVPLLLLWECMQTLLNGVNCDFPEEVMRDMFRGMQFAVRKGSSNFVQGQQQSFFISCTLLQKSYLCVYC